MNYWVSQKNLNQQTLDDFNTGIIFVYSLKKFNKKMTIILKKGTSREEIDAQVKAAQSTKPKHDFKKYVGALKLKEDPLKIQKRMRDEWE